MSTSDIDISQGKTIDDMGSEVIWFVLHTLFAVLTFGIALAAMTASQPDPNAATPKIVMTALAFFLPAIVGSVLARVREGVAATQVWIAGALFFGIMCVWVLDLPTSRGLCAQCTAFEKLWRTFFEVSDGSGLLNGNGMLFGAWIPLSMIGYAIGASLSMPAHKDE